MRVVQQARKDTGLIVSDQITLKVNSKLGDLLKEHLFEVSKVVGAKSINVVPLEDSQTSVVVPVLGDDYLYEIEKVI